MGGLTTVAESASIISRIAAYKIQEIFTMLIIDIRFQQLFRFPIIIIPKLAISIVVKILSNQLLTHAATKIHIMNV